MQDDVVLKERLKPTEHQCESFRGSYRLFDEFIPIPAEAGVRDADERRVIFTSSKARGEAIHYAFFATLPSVGLLFVLVELGPPGMAQAPAHSPEQGPASSLGTFLDLDDLSCHQTMGFAVDRFSGLFARSLDQAKNRARAFIEPVL
jgi:hypothetical protein